ncbi:MAG TPA: hemerythrin domain-containing protein [Aromatoleum sp.]|uniref:hemerythrin domain-containing protein n=1 Tax=Aromatoleum sp. TaxID=2307007 RepID=UPI002B48423F|nr:hemerythrin domain-containing protein [Aromatoleum sp.]HJV27989.1 hemerythrin domain-containing protein [Aromatoleum sp.]
MKPEAIQIIRDEHLAISAVLYSLRYLVKEMRKGAAPNFPLLRAILDYIVSYPDRWHHPKEDKYLFAAVKKRTRDADGLIGRLEREHEMGYPMVEDLKRQLVAFQGGDTAAGEAFFDAADRYAELEWQHLRTEEEVFMPIAERVLSPEDWAEIATAFRENDNPLFGIKPKDEAETLYRRILSLAPAPIGFGKAD